MFDLATRYSTEFVETPFIQTPELRKRAIYIARALPIPYCSQPGPHGDTLANKVTQGAAFKAATAAHPLDAVVSGDDPATRKTHGWLTGRVSGKIHRSSKVRGHSRFPSQHSSHSSLVVALPPRQRNPLFAQSPIERIAYLVELLRKWIGARCRGGFQYLGSAKQHQSWANTGTSPFICRTGSERPSRLISPIFLANP